MRDYDVMISYSTERSDVAKDIRDILLENSISVWMAPYSIPAGSDYRDEIYAAIEKCKIVLFVLCEESLNSKWCKNELIYAVKRNKKFFPVQISEIINPYNKLKEINVVLERHQIIKLFPEYEKKITKAINDVKLLLSNKEYNCRPYPQNSYEYEDDQSLLVGRDDVINEIYSLIQKHHITNVYGMGGIGKTTIIKKLFTNYLISGAFQSVHIAKYTNSLKKTIAHIPFIGFNEVEFLDSIKNTNIQKEDALFERKLLLLNECSNECLLIIDGIDYVDNSELECLYNLSLPIILTSRCTYKNVYNYEVKPMSESELITLYVNYSRLDLNENNNEELYIIQILKDIGYHTLTAKLIACYAFDIGLLPSDVVADGVINDLALYDNQDEQISTIIDKYKLEDNELYALRVLALFPNGISKGKFQKLDRVTLRLYPQLVNKGLVIGSDTTYQLHQIIREIIIKKYSITTINIKPFLEEFIEHFRYLGFEPNELFGIVKHIVDSVSGFDYLMVKAYHLFGNWLCDYGYSNMFHVSTATYESQDMNFATKTNEHRVNYDYFEYSLTLNKKALDLSRVLTDLKELKLVPYIISYMGSTNYNMNNFEKALEYQKMALVEARKYIEPTHHDFLVILNRLGLTAIETKAYDDAIAAFLEYEEIGNASNLNVNYSMISYNLGNVYLGLNDYAKAKEYFIKSISQIKDDFDTSFGYSELCMALAKVYKYENNNAEARKYYLIAKDIKKRIIIDDDVIKEFINNYDNIYLD